MFRIASPEDFPALAALWGEAFGDSPDAVARFFEAFPRCRSYVADEDGRIVSMVHALPQVLSPDVPAAYIYAVATAQSHRGRGLCRELMAFAENLEKATIDTIEGGVMTKDLALLWDGECTAVNSRAFLEAIAAKLA